MRHDRGGAHLLGLAAILLATGCGAPTGAPLTAIDTPEVLNDHVLARVYGTPITQSEVNGIYERMSPELRAASTGETRARVLDQLIDTELVARAARQQRMEFEPDIARRLSRAASYVLRDAYVEQINLLPIDEAQILQIYDGIYVPNNKGRQLRLSHILLDNEEQARTIIGALADGTDFVELATLNSLAPDAARGGDLGYISDADLDRALLAAAARLEPGAVAPEPVQTNEGWEIIKLVDIRAEPLVPFEDMRPIIEQQIRSGRLRDHIAQLRTDADIEK